VDALAVRGDERRGSLRKALGSWQQTLNRGYLNGGTRYDEGRIMDVRKDIQARPWELKHLSTKRNRNQK